MDLLRSRGVERVGVLGVSKGAEAALLTAVHEPLVDVVVAVSPTALVWCNVGPGPDGRRHPYRSSWTWRGRPLSFVPMDDSWRPAETDGPVSVRGWYDLSESTFDQRLDAAAIPVEKARADVLLVAGGDDAMWPSLPHAERLAARRRAAGTTVRLVTRPDAGHRPRFPGEDPAEASQTFLYGGHHTPTPRSGSWPGRPSSTHSILLPPGPSPGSKRRRRGRPVAPHTNRAIRLERQWVAEELGPAAHALQRRIKEVFDPRGILNPGKTL